MPRQINPELEQKVLNAARKLWRKGGEESLSMRAIAKAAGTNTPAVYRRFKGREEIMRALVRLYQQELLQCLQPCRSPQEIAQAYIDFALRRPREYELMMSGLLARTGKTRPNVDFVMQCASRWLGSNAEDHFPLVYALASLLHGHVMLKISESVPPRPGYELDEHELLKTVVDLLIVNEAKLRKSSERLIHR